MTRYLEKFNPILQYRNGASNKIKDSKKRRKCALCGHNLSLFHVSFEQMMLACENLVCDYPFGYEAVQIVSNDSELVERPVKATKDFFEYPVAGEPEAKRMLENILTPPTTIKSSMSCISECDSHSQIDADDLEKQETLATKLYRRSEKRKAQRQKNREVQHDLKLIKELTEEMNKILGETESESTIITNKKWLENLKVWEARSGKKLLKAKENKELLKNQPRPREKEFKISIDPINVAQGQAVNISILSNIKEDAQKSTDDNAKN